MWCFKISKQTHHTMISLSRYLSMIWKYVALTCFSQIWLSDTKWSSAPCGNLLTKAPSCDRQPQHHSAWRPWTKNNIQKCRSVTFIDSWTQIRRLYVLVKPFFACCKLAIQHDLIISLTECLQNDEQCLPLVGELIQWVVSIMMYFPAGWNPAPVLVALVYPIM